jgi:hypothetical protein
MLEKQAAKRIKINRDTTAQQRWQQLKKSGETG